MGTLSVAPVTPSKLKPSFFEENRSLFPYGRPPRKRNLSMTPVARLFGPAIFEASKLKVLFLGVDEKKHPGKLPRTYTLTHSDITSKLTLAISQTINNSQIAIRGKERSNYKRGSWNLIKWTCGKHGQEKNRGSNSSIKSANECLEPPDSQKSDK